jgi:HPt (histidine-containing phosphotransfer) domain-containing protein
LPAAAIDVPPPASAVAAEPTVLVEPVEPAVPGFDAAKVRRWLNDAPDAWRSIVRIFVADYPAATAAIGAALDAGDRALAGDLLHRLRGAAGALGADELAAVAERLELVLAGDGPVDAELRTRFFASAAAARAVLAELEVPAETDAPARGAGPDFGDQGRRMRELQALLEAGNTRALDHLPWLEDWVRAEAPEEGRELLRQIEALDFPAALETLRGLEEDVVTSGR